MKTRTAVLRILTILCIFSGVAVGQEFSPSPNSAECWAPDMVIQEGDLPTETAVIRGGREITTQGTLRVLVIFVRFADDTYNHPLYWPDYTALPAWAQNMVNPQVPQNGIYTPGNMSDFFDRASGGDGSGSLGSFRLIGDVYYVTTNSPRAFYGNSIRAVNEHVLTKLDPVVDYTLYDNWKFMANDSAYNHEYLPGVGDGKVDYIFMNWRHVSPSDTGGNLGVKNLHADVVKDGKVITFSSGSTQFRYARPNRNIGGPYEQVPGSILVPAHEFTHYIFGGNNITGHLDGRTVHQFPPIPNIGNVQFFALMTSTSTAPFSAYERYRAGWLNPDIIETNMSSVLLMDTHIKNKAVMIPVRYDNNTPPNIVEYFLVENFHTRNDYSAANPFLRRQLFDHTLRKGLIVFHVENEDLSLPTNSNLDIECADGLWQWAVVQGASTPSDRTDDLIGHGTPTYHTGFDERDQITITVGTVTWTYFALRAADNGCGTGNPCNAPCTLTQCNHGWRYTKSSYLGDNEDFFRENQTDVFSSFSNPSTYRADGITNSNTGFEIVSYNSGLKEYVLKVGVNASGVQALKPSKPQNLRSISADGCATTITWARNREPDLSGYNIYRGVLSGSGEPTYTKINSTLVTDTTYVDANYGSLVGLPRSADLYHRYRVTCVDTQGKESVRSEYVDAFFTHIIDGQVAANWNMISIPVVVCNFAKTAVYPTATSPAYRYTPSGYVATNTLSNNFGWWIKFDSLQTVTYWGSKIDSMAMPVSSGWNIIGSISVPVETCAVTSIPAGIRLSQFFKYQNGYVLTDKLHPFNNLQVRSAGTGNRVTGCV